MNVSGSKTRSTTRARARLADVDLRRRISHDGRQLFTLEVRSCRAPNHVGECAHHPVATPGPGEKRPHVLQQLQVRVPLAVDQQRGVAILSPIGVCREELLVYMSICQVLRRHDWETATKHARHGKRNDSTHGPCMVEVTGKRLRRLASAWLKCASRFHVD